MVWLDGTLGVEELSSSHRSKPRCCWRRLEEEDADAEGKAATGDSGRRAISRARSSGEAYAAGR